MSHVQRQCPTPSRQRQSPHVPAPNAARIALRPKRPTDPSPRRSMDLACPTPHLAESEPASAHRATSATGRCPSAADTRRSGVACFVNRQQLAGTRRVQEVEHARARAGIDPTRASRDLQEERGRGCPAVSASTDSRTSMVRRGSTVRVRQRASRKRLQIGYSACPDGKRLSRAGTRGVVLMFARRSRSHADFGLTKRI